MEKTLFDKIWDAHVVREIEDGPSVLYIDRHYIHEVTSPQAFDGLRARGLDVFRPALTTATSDHNTPTVDQHLPVSDEQSRRQLAMLASNCSEYGITHYGLGSAYNGIVHVIGPELGLTLPGMTIVCGDSHTSTHGALGAVAFGIGTSEVEMVLASQCIMQQKPRTMRITVEGTTAEAVTAKDIILYIISKLGTDGGTGYFVEYAGSTIRNLSIEGRMTLCNMSIEMGARGGMVAPDHKTIDYLRGRLHAPSESEFCVAADKWQELFSDEKARFDMEYSFRAEEIPLMITYGTNPGMAIPAGASIPSSVSFDVSSTASFHKALDYMGLKEGERLTGKKIDYVFLGSCTNGRIEDLRLFAGYVRGKKKAPGVVAWIVPGSQMVARQAEEEGIVKILNDAGFEMRQPGCSACLAMNDDKIPDGCYCLSTSNRNFEGRQGPGARTFLAGPLLAAAAAVSGVITDPFA